MCHYFIFDFHVRPAYWKNWPRAIFEFTLAVVVAKSEWAHGIFWSRVYRSTFKLIWRVIRRTWMKCCSPTYAARCRQLRVIMYYWALRHCCSGSAMQRRGGGGRSTARREYMHVCVPQIEWKTFLFRPRFSFARFRERHTTASIALLIRILRSPQ